MSNIQWCGTHTMPYEIKWINLREVVYPTYNYAKCDGCDCDMTNETGCNSYWKPYDDGLYTICDKCRSDMYGDNNPP